MSGPGSAAVPAVSVVIPFRNAAATLAGTLDSLAAQSRSDWEALLIDDASQDAGPDLVQARAGGDPRLRLLQPGRHLGVAGARNLGIRAARARYIAFLDADDLWLPEKLARQLPVLEAGAPLVFSSYERIDVAGRHLRSVRAKARVGYRDLLAGNPIGCLTAIWDRETFGRAELPDWPVHEDYAFWLQLLRSGAEATGLPEVLAQYRVRPGSHSSARLRALRGTWAILRSQPGLSRPAAGFALGRHVVQALGKRI